VADDDGQERGGAPPPAAGTKAPGPQPERHESRQEDPTLGTLSKADYKAILLRGMKETMADSCTNIAAALAYYGFLAIPAALLVGLGLFGLLASPSTVDSALRHLQGVVPGDAIKLLTGPLKDTTKGSSGIVLVIVGLVLALWTLTGTMTTLMWGLNVAYERDETRGFVKKRLTALGMLGFALLAVVLVLGLLVLGPSLSGWIGDAIGSKTLVVWLWWTLQWPVLLGALLVAFGGILYLGPNVDHPKFQFISFGAVFAVVVWLAASGLFALYTANFGSYNKTWGSLSAVIIMLTWLWLSGLALLIGAEINAEAERSRELRRGEPAEQQLQAPAKS
jgi:membrane protein